MALFPKFGSFARRLFGARSLSKLDKRLKEIQAEAAKLQSQPSHVSTQRRADQDTADRRLARIREEREALERKREKQQQAAQERDPAYRFVYLGEMVETPQSSNVRTIQYTIKEDILVISFKDGSVYGYEPVYPQEAKSLLQSASKGTWVWDNLRIRKTKLGHRKRYYLITGNRKWDATRETARAHGLEALRQSGQTVGQRFLPHELKFPETNKGRRPRVFPTVAHVGAS